MKMKYAYLLIATMVFICSSFLSSCDKKNDKESGSTYSNYHIKDTDGLDLESIIPFIDVNNQNTIWLYGIKNNKIWIGVFDIQTKEQLQEWNGTDEITQRGYPDLLVTTDLYTLISLSYGGNQKSMSLYKLENGVVINYLNDFSSFLELENVTYFSGFKDDKVWFAVFEHDSNNFKEWIGSEKFNRDIVIDEGYGEYRNIHVDNISLRGVDVGISGTSILKTSWGYAVIPGYVPNEGWGVIGDLFFFGKNVIQYSFRDKIFMPEMKEWYNGSVLLTSRDELFNMVLSSEGKEIVTLKEKPVNGFEKFPPQPVSYTDGLNFELSNVTRKNYESGESVWQSEIPSLANVKHDARVVVTILDNSDKRWKVQYDITNKDGSKQQSIFTVDIETGEIIEG